MTNDQQHQEQTSLDSPALSTLILHAAPAFTSIVPRELSPYMVQVFAWVQDHIKHVFFCSSHHGHVRGPHAEPGIQACRGSYLVDQMASRPNSLGESSRASRNKITILSPVPNIRRWAAAVPARLQVARAQEHKRNSAENRPRSLALCGIDDLSRNEVAQRGFYSFHLGTVIG